MKKNLPQLAIGLTLMLFPLSAHANEECNLNYTLDVTSKWGAYRQLDKCKKGSVINMSINKHWTSIIGKICDFSKHIDKAPDGNKIKLMCIHNGNKLGKSSQDEGESSQMSD